MSRRILKPINNVIKTAKSEVYKIFSKIQVSIKGGISSEYNQENQICSFGKSKMIKKIGKNLLRH